MTLEERINRLEDREAIRDLTNAINWHSDEADLDSLFEHLVDDVVFDVGEFGTYQGKADLRAFYEQTFAAFTMRRHNVINHIIDLDGDRATSKSYWHAELVLNGRAMMSAGTYHDELVRRDGRWKVAVRRTTIAYLTPLDEGWARTRIFQIQ